MNLVCRIWPAEEASVSELIDDGKDRDIKRTKVSKEDGLASFYPSLNPIFNCNPLDQGI